ncbi:GIY-YIG nuclease family protein [soil metagenome]
MSYFTYILTCADGTYYIGKTTDLKRRLRQHNGEIKGGAKYTRIRRPVRFCFTEEHDSLSNALKREIALKRLTRREKTILIKTINLPLV